MEAVTEQCRENAPVSTPTIVAVLAHPASPSFHWVYLSDGRVLHFQADSGKVDRVLRVPLDGAAE